MPYDVDVDVEAAIVDIATRWGVRTDAVAPIVDQYGVDLCKAAAEEVQDEIANGFVVQKPFGYMISLLRKGVIQVKAQAEEAGKADADRLYERYHRGKWLKQHDGIAGPGSCSCCVDGGPYAGKEAP